MGKRCCCEAVGLGGPLWWGSMDGRTCCFGTEVWPQTMLLCSSRNETSNPGARSGFKFRCFVFVGATVASKIGVTGSAHVACNLCFARVSHQSMSSANSCHRAGLKPPRNARAIVKWMKLSSTTIAVCAFVCVCGRNRQAVSSCCGCQELNIVMVYRPDRSAQSPK